MHPSPATQWLITTKHITRVRAHTALLLPASVLNGAKTAQDAGWHEGVAVFLRAAGVLSSCLGVLCNTAGSKEGNGGVIADTTLTLLRGDEKGCGIEQVRSVDYVGATNMTASGLDLTNVCVTKDLVDGKIFPHRWRYAR